MDPPTYSIAGLEHEHLELLVRSSEALRGDEAGNAGTDDDHVVVRAKALPECFMSSWRAERWRSCCCCWPARP